MSAEFWATVGVGVALVGVIVPLILGLHASVRSESAALRVEMRTEFAAISERLSALDQRVARLEGAFQEMRRWSELVINTVNRPAA